MEAPLNVQPIAGNVSWVLFPPSWFEARFGSPRIRAMTVLVTAALEPARASGTAVVVDER